MSLFPAIQPGKTATAAVQELPLCREVAWNYQADRPIFSRGEPVIVSGKEAVKVWIWKAIYTVRYRYEIYSWDYGSELESLIGQAYTPTVKEAEAPRYLRECLETNPYITSVRNIEVSFDTGHLTVKGTVTTIYGEVEIDATI